jgi:hypothetical protein
MARSLINIGSLDTHLQEALGKVASASEFQLTVWRHNPDATGCNWNAHFERIAHLGSADKRWWDVVPRLRATFNLATVAP